MSLLEVAGVRSGYGRSEVIHGVDLRVPSGSAVALLGANGAGKSTLLKTLAGLLRPTAGRITFRGQDISHWPPFRRSAGGLCLIPEGRAIFRRLTVRENLAMQVGGHDVRGAVRQVTAMFPRLGDRLGQVAGTLSGGEQQMLALGRALLTDPTLVMADELSVGLAPVLVDEIFEAVGALRAQGRSLLIVEQYVERVLGLADYVYLLHKGRVVFVGEPGQCRENDLFAQYAGVAV